MSADEKCAAIDPVELMGVIIGYAPNRRIDLQVAFRDRVLALVRPVEGVTLTPEEVVTVKFALDYTRNRAVLGGRDQAHMKALAARLEAAP